MSDSSRWSSFSLDSKLVFDVGFYRGFDTAHYLSRGFRVVAVEADPVLVEIGSLRFEREIASGQLAILGVGIAERTGRDILWTAPGHRGLNSFVRQRLAGRKVVPVEVPTRKFSEILEEHGIPHYLKIDIEGSDHLCIEALQVGRLPNFVSFELTRLDQGLLLRDLGYSRFKVLTQNDQRQFPDRMHPKTRLRLRLREHPRLEWLVAKLLPRCDGGLHRQRRAGRPGSPGPSGPFGEETDGIWTSWDDLEASWRRWFPRGDEGSGSVWFDLHASGLIE